MEQPVCVVCTWNTSILLSRDFIPIRIVASSMSYLAGLAIWKNHRGSSSQSCILYGPCHEAEGNHSWRIEKLHERTRKIRSQKNKWKENIMSFVRTLKSRFNKKINWPSSQIYATLVLMVVFWSHPKWNCKQSSNESKSTGSLRASFRVQQETSRFARTKVHPLINLKHNRILNWVFGIFPKSKALQYQQSSKKAPDSGPS